MFKAFAGILESELMSELMSGVNKHIGIKYPKSRGVSNFQYNGTTVLKVRINKPLRQLAHRFAELIQQTGKHSTDFESNPQHRFRGKLGDLAFSIAIYGEPDIALHYMRIGESDSGDLGFHNYLFDVKTSLVNAININRHNFKRDIDKFDYYVAAMVPNVSDSMSIEQIIESADTVLILGYISSVDIDKGFSTSDAGTPPEHWDVRKKGKFGEYAHIDIKGLRPIEQLYTLMRGKLFKLTNFKNFKSHMQTCDNKCQYGCHCTECKAYSDSL